MSAKKWRLRTDDQALVFKLNVQAKFPEQRRAQAGPLIGYIATRSLADGPISGLDLWEKCATANSFNFTRAYSYSWGSKGHTGTTALWENFSQTNEIH